MDTVVKQEGIICAGNWIVDVIHEIDYWPNKSDLTRIRKELKMVGGGAANVLHTLNQLALNVPLHPCGALGDDDYAQIILANCEQANLATGGFVKKLHTPTAHTHVMTVPGESRTFFYDGGANDLLNYEDISAFISKTKASIFYLGYLMLLKSLDRLRPDGLTDASMVLKVAQASGMTTIVDLVSADDPNYSRVVTVALPYIDILVANEIEASRASGINTVNVNGTVSELGVLMAAQDLLRKGVKKAVVVHSPNTTLWYSNNEEVIWFRPKRLSASDIVSHLGAGDAFCAGLISGIHSGLNALDSLKLANKVASSSLLGATAYDSVPSLKTLL